MKYSILSLLLISGCASKAHNQLEVLVKTPEQPICQGNKPAKEYSLTIMAYNQATKGIRIEAAKEETDEQAAFYDIFAYNVVPAILLESEYKVTTDEDNYQTLHFRDKSMKFVPEASYNGGPVATQWGQGGGGILRKKFREMDIKILPHMLHPQPLLIPFSPKGDQLIVCPKNVCKGLKSPLDSEEIVEIDVYPSKALGTEKNPYLEVTDLDDYNDVDSDFFLFDLISKSQARIGSKFLNSYFVVPRMDQEKICHEMKTWELGYPSGCFETGFKNNEERGNFNYLDPKFKSTFLSESGAVACCEKMENGRVKCHQGSSADFTCEPNEELNQKYMDAVVRDYIMNKSFSVEKKNSGKWSIYKIKFDPSIMCKYARDVNELTNN